MIPYLVPTLLLTIALPHFCGGGTMDANYAEGSPQSFHLVGCVKYQCVQNV